VIPAAHADVGSQEVKDALFMYSVGNGASQIEDIFATGRDSEYIQSRGWLANWIAGPRPVQCKSSGGLVDTSTIDIDIPGNDHPRRLTVTPVAKDSFIVKGLRKGQTYRITLGQRTLEGGQRVLHPEESLANGVVVPCVDQECNELDETAKYPLTSQDMLMGRTPEEVAKSESRNSADYNRSFQDENTRHRRALVNKLVGLSVLGDCCTEDVCREKLRAKGTDLQPTASSPESTR
jgi:hypothetical protein